MVWMIYFDGVPIAHYQYQHDCERDVWELRNNLKGKCPVIMVKRVTQTWS